VRKVVDSFSDDPIVLRGPRYVRRRAGQEATLAPRKQLITLIVNEDHSIHHVRERGYVESPVRVKSILAELDKSGLFDRVKAQRHGEHYIRAVHDNAFVSFLKRACANVDPDKSVYPYVFPIRNQTRPPKELPLRAGYFCIDTFTPLNRNAFKAAIGAVDCALTGARSILEGKRAAYALVRPPGHHAERSVFGGFCYFNSASIAANELSRFGKVALLDIDYHHGNGTQDIFWERADVLTISTHGNPRLSYPYFSGFEDEVGAGEGKGYNLNLPLPENIDGERYRKALGKALKRIREFEPRFLVISLGLDTAKGDPTGSWTLGLPTLVVQEGGYRTRTLGTNARHFFVGFADAAGLAV
jgi:acetoin utilization deacetylase AcuC-like enzyme